VVRINPKKSRKNSKGEDIFDVDEEETNASNIGKFLFNLSRITWNRFDTKIISVKGKREVHERDEKKERRAENDDDWSNVKGSEVKGKA
jgi:hypothetical protein